MTIRILTYCSTPLSPEKSSGQVVDISPLKGRKLAAQFRGFRYLLQRLLGAASPR